MKQVPIKLGPLALLLTVISICLTTLAILTFSTARADVRLAEKYAETVQTRYALEAEGQTLLAGQDIPAELEPDAGGVYRLELRKDGALLHIGLAQEGDSLRVVLWRHEREWTEDTGIGNLWAGN